MAGLKYSLPGLSRKEKEVPTPELRAETRSGQSCQSGVHLSSTQEGTTPLSAEMPVSQAQRSGYERSEDRLPAYT